MVYKLLYSILKIFSFTENDSDRMLAVGASIIEEMREDRLFQNIHFTEENHGINQDYLYLQIKYKLFNLYIQRRKQ